MGTVGDIITHVTFIHLLLQTCQDQSASHIIQISHPMHLLMQVSQLEGVFHSVSPVADDKLVGPGQARPLELETKVYPKVRNHGEGPY